MLGLLSNTKLDFRIPCLTKIGRLSILCARITSGGHTQVRERERERCENEAFPNPYSVGLTEHTRSRDKGCGMCETKFSFSALTR